MRTEPPPPPHTAAIPDRRLAYAGFWSRAGAMAIDLLVTALWAAPLRRAFAALTEDPAVLGPFRVSGLVVLGLLWAYFVVATGLTGGTLGKHALGIRVISAGFARPDWETVLFREVVGRIIVAASLGIGYLWAAFDPRKQGWHDRIADTLVVKKVAVLPAVDPWQDDLPAARLMGRHRAGTA
ncbi:MAG TPA: RDD family protein [Actinomycetota bacterium]|nr:RDD family protein [Actinomycetota bacterium]